MRHFITFIFATLFSITIFSSCDSSIEKDIKTEIGFNIKKLTIKAIPVTEKYYEYVEEVSRLTTNYTNSVDEYGDYIHECTEALDFMEIYSGSSYFRREYNSYLRKYENYKALVDSVYVLLEDKETLAKDAITKYGETGTLYVARYIAKNKFNKWEKTHSYTVYSYNDDNTIHRYTGEDALEIIINAYPKAQKELKNMLSDTLTEMIDVLNEVF